MIEVAKILAMVFKKLFHDVFSTFKEFCKKWKC